MPQREREDATGFGRGDDAQLRSLNGKAPCGRKESGNDGRRAQCRRRHYRRRECGHRGVVKPEDQAAPELSFGREVAIICSGKEPVAIIKIVIDWGQDLL